MQINTITPSDRLWKKVEEYAENCSWRAGKSLSDKMKKHSFEDWERVVICFEDDDIYGYLAVDKNDCIPNISYTPYISYVFVGEEYRGNRISQKMIEFALSYLKSLGFDRAHIVSDHENLYEKYGFEVIDRKVAPWGALEKIYMRKL